MECSWGTYQTVGRTENQIDVNYMINLPMFLIGLLKYIDPADMHKGNENDIP